MVTAFLLFRLSICQSFECPSTSKRANDSFGVRTNGVVRRLCVINFDTRWPCTLFDLPFLCPNWANKTNQYWWIHSDIRYRDLSVFYSIRIQGNKHFKHAVTYLLLVCPRKTFFLISHSIVCSFVKTSSTQCVHCSFRPSLRLSRKLRLEQSQNIIVDLSSWTLTENDPSSEWFSSENWTLPQLHIRNDELWPSIQCFCSIESRQRMYRVKRSGSDLFWGRLNPAKLIKQAMLCEKNNV